MYQRATSLRLAKRGFKSFSQEADRRTSKPMGKERHQNHAEGGKGKRQKHWVTDLASQFNLFSRTIQLILLGNLSYFARQNKLFRSTK